MSNEPKVKLRLPKGNVIYDDESFTLTTAYPSEVRPGDRLHVKGHRPVWVKGVSGNTVHVRWWRWYDWPVTYLYAIWRHRWIHALAIAIYLMLRQLL